MELSFIYTCMNGWTSSSSGGFLSLSLLHSALLLLLILYSMHKISYWVVALYSFRTPIVHNWWRKSGGKGKSWSEENWDEEESVYVCERECLNFVLCWMLSKRFRRIKREKANPLKAKSLSIYRECERGEGRMMKVPSSRWMKGIHLWGKETRKSCVWWKNFYYYCCSCLNIKVLMLF